MRSHCRRLQQELTEKARNEGGAHLRLPMNIATLFIGCKVGLEYAQHIGALNEEEALALMNVAWRVLIGLGERQQEVAVEEKPVDYVLQCAGTDCSRKASRFCGTRTRRRTTTEPGPAWRSARSTANSWAGMTTSTGTCCRRRRSTPCIEFYKTSGTIFPDTERGVRVKLLEQKRLFPNKDRYTYRLRLSTDSKARVLRVGRPNLESAPSHLEAGTPGTTVTAGTEEEE